MPTFKEVADLELNKKLHQAKDIQMQLPYYFRMKKYDPEKSRAFLPLDKKAGAEKWHETIMWIQLCLKDTRSDASDSMEAMKELLKFTMESFHSLVDAYDIQGRVLLKLCERSGVDFDDLVADFSMSHNDKGVAYVVQNTEVEVQHTEQEETVEKDNSSSLPF